MPDILGPDSSFLNINTQLSLEVLRHFFQEEWSIHCHWFTADGNLDKGKKLHSD